MVRATKLSCLDQRELKVAQKSWQRGYAALACAYEADTARHSAPLRLELAIPFQAAWHVHQKYRKHFPVDTGTHDDRGQTPDGTHLSSVTPGALPVSWQRIDQYLGPKIGLLVEATSKL
jgi:hypothetical protein